MTIKQVLSLVFTSAITGGILYDVGMIATGVTLLVLTLLIFIVSLSFTRR
jgi:hypothetical protein